MRSATMPDPMNLPASLPPARAARPLLYGWLAALALAAQPTAGAPVLTLEDAIARSLEANLSIRLSRFDPEIAAASVIAEEAAFDPSIFLQADLSQSEQSRSLTATQGTSSDSRRLNSGVRKSFATGAQVTAQTNLSRRDNNAGVNISNLAQNADFSLSLRQPLLRGFGSATNRARIVRAGAGLEAARAGLHAALLSLIAETERAYWQLASADNRLRLRESSLEVAESLLAETRAKEQVGLATRVDVLQAEAARATRREEIIEAKRQLADAADALLRLLNRIDERDPEAFPWEVESLPGEPASVPQFARVWDHTLQRHPDLEAQEATITQAETDRLLARDRLKPNLDFTVTGAWSGIDDRRAPDAIENALNRDGKAWGVGLEFNLPWGRRAEKAGLLQADRRLEREELRLLDLRQRLLREVRSGHRNLIARGEGLDAARLTLELQEAAFAQERGKFNSGISTFRAVLEAQRDLDLARIRHLEATLQLIYAEIELERLAGTLPERHGIQIDY